jgi:GTP-binding protein
MKAASAKPRDDFPEKAMYRVTSSQYITSVVSLAQLPEARLPEVAFAGRSNVGKSSLINSLLGHRRLAQTSSTPGKTQMLNFFLVNERLYFVDLPGYGYAKVARSLRDRWGQLVEPYIRRRETLAGVIHLVDCRHEPTEADQLLAEWLDSHGIPTLVVLTKADKLSRHKSLLAREQARKNLGREKERCILFSAKTGLGRGEVWKWIIAKSSPFQREQA